MQARLLKSVQSQTIFIIFISGRRFSSYLTLTSSSRQRINNVSGRFLSRNKSRRRRKEAFYILFLADLYHPQRCYACSSYIFSLSPRGVIRAPEHTLIYTIFYHYPIKHNLICWGSHNKNHSPSLVRKMEEAFDTCASN